MRDLLWLFRQELEQTSHFSTEVLPCHVPWRFAGLQRVTTNAVVHFAGMATIPTICSCITPSRETSREHSNRSPRPFWQSWESVGVRTQRACQQNQWTSQGLLRLQVSGKDLMDLKVEDLRDFDDGSFGTQYSLWITIQHVRENVMANSTLASGDSWRGTYSYRRLQKGLLTVV